MAEGELNFLGQSDGSSLSGLRIAHSQFGLSKAPKKVRGIIKDKPRDVADDCKGRD